MSALSVPVVVVTNAGPTDRVRRSLAALAVDGVSSPVIVVDNSTADEVGPGAYGPGDVEVVRMANRGYGAAANVGFRAARQLAPNAAMVALLNDDIEVESGWLAPLIAAVSAGAAAAQPKLMQAPPQAQPLVNSVGVQLDEFGAGTDIGHLEPDGPPFETGRDVSIFMGGAVVFSTAFLDATQGFDERFFLYYEDVDLALRGAELGFGYRCEPESIVWHEGGASSAALGNRTRRLQERNRLWCAVRFLPRQTVRQAFGLSVRRLRHDPRATHARALAAGCARGPQLMLARRRARRLGSATR